MSNIPTELKYAKSHEWVRDEGDGTVFVGITDHAQEQLGDLKGEMEVALDEVEAKYDALIADTKEVPVAPKKTDVRVAMFGVAWVPHYLVESGGRTLEVPAYTAE